MTRSAAVSRETAETTIDLTLDGPATYTLTAWYDVDESEDISGDEAPLDVSFDTYALDKLTLYSTHHPDNDAELVADGPAGTRAGPALPGEDVVPVTAVPCGVNRPAQFQGGAGRRIGLAPMVHIQDLGIEFRTQLARGAGDQPAQHGHAHRDLSGTQLAGAVLRGDGVHVEAVEGLAADPGQLLDRLLLSVGFRREEVYICNVLKSRPPGNRDPRDEEIEACSPFLLRQLDLLDPKVIVAFGAFAARTLTGTSDSLGGLREQVHAFQGYPLVATYHPAALLRNRSWTRPTWDDLQRARRIVDGESVAGAAEQLGLV